MSTPVIQVDNLGVRFRLAIERADTLKETLIKLVKRRLTYRDFWAIHGLAFSISPGESVGIIGRNGSGKSTLLKILAGVYEPTAGSCKVVGRVAPLIELGAGFNGELTGRENVFLNGAILGRTHAEMEDLYPEIVEFTELHDFMDVPVKNYSSGMYARLGFAIATAVNGDILLMDEVLAVGDEAFQKKCLARLEQQLAANKTVCFVSHDANTMERICKRAIVLDHGRLVFDSSTALALAEYRKLLASTASLPAAHIG